MSTIALYGRLGHDKNIKEVNGKRVMELNLATTLKEKGENTTMWWKVTFWEDNYRKIEEYLKKGAALIIHGELKTPRTYVDKEGNNRVSLEVTGHNIRFSPFGGKAKEEETTPESQQATPAWETSDINLPEC
jgi:single stranded DNA-binding protein